MTFIAHRSRYAIAPVIKQYDRVYSYNVCTRRMMTQNTPRLSVIVVGGVSWDYQIYLDNLPQPYPQTLFSKRSHETVGSTGAGKALALNRLGLRTHLHALWGEDVYGSRIRAAFEREALPFLHDVDPRGTERHVNVLDDEGRRISIYTQAGSLDPQINMDALRPTLETCDIVALNIINYARRLIEPARTLGKPIWCDIHDYDGTAMYHRDFVQAADVIFMSSDAMPDYRAFMRELADDDKRIVVCTHGKRGATAYVNGEWLQQPALPVAAVDTNGAGDNFFAGYLYGYEQGYSPQKCLQMATITASTCVGSPELIAQDLSAERVERRWQELFG